MEQELKFRLPDRATYDRLAAALGPELRREEQVNHYLDTPARDVARSGKSMLRLRGEVLTFKLGVRQADGYFQAEELEVAVSTEQARELLEGRLPATDLAPLERLEEVFGPCPGLQLQGTMRNLRRVFQLGQDLAELDETSFPDGSVDYELEVETTNPEAVRRRLTELGFTLEPSESTKFARFLQRQGPGPDNAQSAP